MEKRKFLVNLKFGLEDDTVLEYKNEEEIEYEFGENAEKIIQIEKDGKKYKVKLTFIRIKKGWFGDRPVACKAEMFGSSLHIAATQYEEAKDIQWRKEGKILVGFIGGFVFLALVGLITWLVLKDRTKK